MPAEEQKKARHNLLKYCELDTYAMVKVWGGTCGELWKEMQKMEIEKEVTEFVKTINRGPLKEYFPKEKTEEKKIDWNKDDVYVEALYQGYLDACRTFKWSEKVKKDYPNEEAKRGT